MNNIHNICKYSPPYWIPLVSALTQLKMENQMKKSRKPTKHVLVKAYTKNIWDGVEFAIIYVTASWKVLIQSRLQAISQFKTEADFNCHSYWDASIGYFSSPDKCSLTKGILTAQEDWAYVTLTPDEELTFRYPKNRLEAHQLLITANGIAHFKAYGKHPGEEYWTAEFDLNKLINK